MRYYVDCECSKLICVELFQAGTDVTCPKCGDSVAVPSSSKLKEMSGDKHPFASPLERAAIALKNGEVPFTGQCQRCDLKPAEFQQVIDFTFLKKRFLNHDGGVEITGRGIGLVAGASTEEDWGQFSFPLLFCKPCLHEFRDESRQGALQFIASRVAAFVGMALLFAILVLLCLALPFVGVSLAVFLFWRLWEWKSRKRAHQPTLSLISELEWIGDAIRGEDEYVLNARPPIPISVSTPAAQSHRETGNENASATENRDRRSGSIVECPACKIRVGITAEGQCPSCRQPI